MMNKCIFRGFINLETVESREVTRKNFKTGKSEEKDVYDFRFYFNTGKKDKEGKAIYATFFLTTFSDFTMDDFDALIDSKGEDYTVGALVELAYIPYKREVYYEKKGDKKLIDVPQWNVVSMEFLEFIEKEEEKSNKKSKNSKSKKAKQDEDLVDDEDDEDDEEEEKPAKKKKNNNGKATKPSKGNVKKRYEDEEEDEDEYEEDEEEEKPKKRKATGKASSQKKNQKRVEEDEDEDDFDFDDDLDDIEDIDDEDM